MRLPSVALAILALLSAPALAVDLVELKDGRVLEVVEATLKGDKLFVKLHLPKGNQTVAYAIPTSRIVPEFVFYAWRKDVAESDTDGLQRLAEWARTQGLFRHAWRTYEVAAETSPEIRSRLAALAGTLREEEATWTFERAWEAFKAGEVKLARVRVERVLEHFPKSEEQGRAKELLTIIKEREQFLGEQKLQEEIARRARKQRREIDRYLERIARADREVLRVRFRYSGDAKRRLSWAAYAYRKSALAFSELLPVVEVDELRLMLKALLDDLQARLVRTFLKLGDLRFLTGDAAGALDAVHEVLSLEPANKEASGLRDRILDGGSTRAEPRTIHVGFPYRGRTRLSRLHYYTTPGIRIRRGTAFVSQVRGFGVYVPEQTTFRYGPFLHPCSDDR